MKDTPQRRLIRAAFAHDLDGIDQAITDGADINALDDEYGLTALHIAVGQNDLVLSRYLIDRYFVSFRPDRAGRRPSLIAAECEVDAALADYIVEQEALGTRAGSAESLPAQPGKFDDI